MIFKKKKENNTKHFKAISGKCAELIIFLFRTLAVTDSSAD